MTKLKFLGMQACMQVQIMRIILIILALFVCTSICLVETVQAVKSEENRTERETDTGTGTGTGTGNGTGTEAGTGSGMGTGTRTGTRTAGSGTDQTGTEQPGKTGHTITISGDRKGAQVVGNAQSPYGDGDWDKAPKGNIVNITSRASYIGLVCGAYMNDAVSSCNDESMKYNKVYVSRDCTDTSFKNNDIYGAWALDIVLFLKK